MVSDKFLSTAERLQSCHSVSSSVSVSSTSSFHATVPLNVLDASELSPKTSHYHIDILVGLHGDGLVCTQQQMSWVAFADVTCYTSVFRRCSEVAVGVVYVRSFVLVLVLLL